MGLTAHESQGRSDPPSRFREQFSWLGTSNFVIFHCCNQNSSKTTEAPKLKFSMEVRDMLGYNFLKVRFHGMFFVGSRGRPKLGFASKFRPPVLKRHLLTGKPLINQLEILWGAGGWVGLLFRKNRKSIRFFVQKLSIDL